MRRLVSLVLGVMAAFAIENSATLSAGINEWTSHGPEAGSIRALAIDPQSPSTVYAGTTSGIFKSVDRGANWRSVNLGLTRRYVTALAIDPKDPGTIYAGNLSGGVFKSTDRGANWGAMNTGLSESQSIDALVIDPQNPNTAYAVTDGGRGLYKSTDAAMSWSAVTLGFPHRILDLAVNPQDPGTIYAGTAAGGVFKSTDAGANWNPVNSGLPPTASIRALAINRQNPNTVYAGTAPPCPVCSVQNTIFKSTDGAMTWSGVGVNAGVPATSAISALVIDPQDSATIYAGSDGLLFKSMDGGASWNAVNAGLPYLRVNTLAVDPQDPSIVYAGTDFGVSKSADAAMSWSTVNSGLMAAVVSFLVADPKSSGTILAGIQNHGVLKSVDGGTSWTEADLGGLAVNFLFFDPKNPGTLYVNASDIGAGAFKSTDGGKNWTEMDLSFIAALGADPQNTTTLYGWRQYEQLYRSADGGVTWNKPAMAGLPPPCYDCLGPLVLDPQNPRTVYLGLISHYSTYNVQIFKSTDGGESWRAVHSGWGPYSLMSLAVDPQNPDTLYAATDLLDCDELSCPPDYSYRGAGVFKSTDGGATWVQLALPMGYSLSIDPQNPRTVYARGYDKVLKSTDGGASWNTVSSGLTAGVTTLVVDPHALGTVYAGTSGGGVFSITFSVQEN